MRTEIATEVRTTESARYSLWARQPEIGTSHPAIGPVTVVLDEIDLTLWRMRLETLRAEKPPQGNGGLTTFAGCVPEWGGL